MGSAKLFGLTQALHPLRHYLIPEPLEHVSMDRRQFFKRTAAAGAGTFLVGGGPAGARSFAQPPDGKPKQSPNEKVRFACIGIGGKGDSDTNDAGKHGEIVALCDIDSEVLEKMGKKYPNAKKYFDYRK